MENQTEEIVIRSAADLPSTELLGKRPAILLGADTSEITMIAFIAVSLSIPLSLPVGLILEPIFILLFFFVFLIVIFSACLWSLRSVKRQKPYGYYIQLLVVWFDNMFSRFFTGGGLLVRKHRGWNTTRNLIAKGNHHG